MWAAQERGAGRALVGSRRSAVGGQRSVWRFALCQQPCVVSLEQAEGTWEVGAALSALMGRSGAGGRASPGARAAARRTVSSRVHPGGAQDFTSTSAHTILMATAGAGRADTDGQRPRGVSGITSRLPGVADPRVPSLGQGPCGRDAGIPMPLPEGGRPGPSVVSNLHLCVPATPNPKPAEAPLPWPVCLGASEQR